MNNQNEAITKNKPILDACCGGRNPDMRIIDNRFDNPSLISDK